VPYLPTILLIAFGLVLLVVLALRLRGAVRRFGMVRGWLDDYVKDRGGLLRARSAALRVAVDQRVDDWRGARPLKAAPRIVYSDDRQEAHRA
jgi:hypothetical protein